MATGDDFERCFAAAYPRLVRQLFAVVGDVGEAEDVVQEAFARAALAALVRVGPVADVPELSPDATAVAMAMRRLPLRHREVLVLYYLVQLSVEETARQLGIPTGTVKSRLARGRAALVRQLGEERQELRHA